MAWRNALIYIGCHGVDSRRNLNGRPVFPWLYSVGNVPRQGVAATDEYRFKKVRFQDAQTVSFASMLRTPPYFEHCCRFGILLVDVAMSNSLGVSVKLGCCIFSSRPIELDGTKDTFLSELTDHKHNQLGLRLSDALWACGTRQRSQLRQTALPTDS